jgi:hypothetical protein
VSNQTLHCQHLRTAFNNIALDSVTLNVDGDRITVKLKNISKKDIEYTPARATATSTGGDAQSFFYISSGGIFVPATEIPGFLLISPNERHLLSFQKRENDGKKNLNPETFSALEMPGFSSSGDRFVIRCDVER